MEETGEGRSKRREETGEGRRGDQVVRGIKNATAP